MTLYQQLANSLKKQIEEGFYANGQKLPSIRSMSHEREVSISTVQECYRSLEDSGYVSSKYKSGYYVVYKGQSYPRPDLSQPVQEPVTVENWQEALNLTLTQTDDKFLALGGGGPNTHFSTLRPLQKILNRQLRMHTQAAYKPAKGNGLFALRAQIARQMQDSGCYVHPDELLITTGCQEALSLCLRVLTQPSDIVAIDSPSFYGSMQAVSSNQLKVLEIPTHPEKGISLPALELALEQWPIKVLQLIPTTNNPLGYVMPEENKRKLLQLADRYDLAIIEDDIVGDLSYHTPRPASLKSMDKQGRVLMCSSFSKTLAQGLRIGWVAPGRYASKLTHMKFVTSMGSTTLPQMAIAEFIAEGHHAKHLHHARLHYHNSRDQVLRWIARDFPQGCKATFPQGGYWLWVEMPRELDSFELNRQLNGFGIGVAPGGLFSAANKYRHCFRLNFAQLDERVEQAIGVIGEQIELLMKLA
ncbi:PLP-dependent aminotransferase family protein [Aliagarivorans marinus]|uniref:aminotransferase-like domain-containing protein n=1 Tax=Aliagarivorans marinus TaxID=561965 RepID=UPI0003F7F03A|nr:PLP-dependent aminotransferase family protein [Aliagarivorans marinus]